MATHLSRRAASTSRRLSQALSRAMEPPDDFLCPMSHAIMDDPVVAADGHTYERGMIVEWLRREGTSPMTRARMSADVRRNITLKRMIDAWKDESTRPRPDGASPLGAPAGMPAVAPRGRATTSPCSHTIRGKISNDLAELQALHVATGWTPGRDMIRPEPSTRAQKEFFLHNIGEMWASPAEWVFHHIFKIDVAPGDGLRRARARPARDATPPALWAAQFPYAVPDGTQHFVLWCPGPRDEWPDEAITGALAQILGAAPDFCWYENPHKTVEDAALHHVQVFVRLSEVDDDRGS